jgi:PAS domain S-box-containing protein
MNNQMQDSEKTKEELLVEIDQLKIKLEKLTPKQDKKTLGENESKFRKLLDSLDAGVVIHAPDTSIIQNNPRASELLGLSDDQMLGKEAIDPGWKFLHTDNQSLTLDYYPVNQIITKKKSIKNMSIGVVRPQINDVVWLQVNGFPIFNDQNEISEIIISFIDVTELKKSQDTLLKQQTKLTNILKGTNAGIWDWNIKTGECEFNERWARIMGYTLEELMPLDINTWINSVHPDDLPMANDTLEKNFNKELDYFDVDFRQPHKDGSWVWVNARGKVVEWSENGKPLQMSGTHLDITDRKVVEQELAKHLDDLEILVNERTSELEDKNKKLDDAMKVFVGRELKIKQLEDRIRDIEE